MERKSIKPRDNYQRIVENLGFTFHKDYWLEDACYALSMSEVEQIEKATAECYDMYCQAVEKCLYDDRRLDLLRIPQKVRNFIAAAGKKTTFRFTDGSTLPLSTVS